MNIKLWDQLFREGIISPGSHAKIKLADNNKLVSVHWEIKMILYLGVLLLSSGLGILVYKNIDTIGHQVILLLIALVCAGSFVYCTRHKLPFSTRKVQAPHTFFDYVLLLACSMFIIFIAYLQYQYNVFGSRYGLATFFPMVVLFFSAYYFDHFGILALAITTLAAWVGITITPLHILESNDFNSGRVILTGLFLGVFLLLSGWATRNKQFKAHFEFTYNNFGVHIMLISGLAAMFHFVPYLPWFLLTAAAVYFFYLKAFKERSFYFLLIVTLYAYIAASYVFMDLVMRMSGSGIGPFYIGFLYFIGSGLGLVFFLINANKKIKAA